MTYLPSSRSDLLNKVIDLFNKVKVISEGIVYTLLLTRLLSRRCFILRTIPILLGVAGFLKSTHAISRTKKERERERETERDREKIMERMHHEDNHSPTLTLSALQCLTVMFFILLSRTCFYRSLDF